MEIRAAKKLKEKKEVVEKTNTATKVLDRPQKKEERVFMPVSDLRKDRQDYSINLAINTLLYNTMQNIISSSHTANDFTFLSVTDVIRKAIEEYKNGMELTEIDEKGPKTATTIRINEELKKFYDELPNRLRRKIIERAIRTYIKKRNK